MNELMRELIITDTIIIISSICTILVYRYSNKIKVLVKQNQEESISYGKSMVIGIVSGIVVISLDKIITSWLNSIQPLNFSSLYNFTLSLINIFVWAFFIASSLLLIVFYLLYKGLDVTMRKKKI